MDNLYTIEIANTKQRYEGLRTLWCEVFGDEPSFVDAMYENFGADPTAEIYTSNDIQGYVAMLETDTDAVEGSCDLNESNIVSALTCFRSGDFMGRPVYTGYAICTDSNYRGLGLAGHLVERARDDVITKGGISLISPAEPSLEKFYGAHGYISFFFADKGSSGGESDEDFIFDEEDREYEKVHPRIELRALGAAEYNEYRERFLKDIPHVALSEQMLRLVHTESSMPDGNSGMLLINDGDAICTIDADGVFAIEELILNPILAAMSSEIAEEIAAGIAENFGVENIGYRTPGSMHCQSMVAGLTEEMKEEALSERSAYYGFPVE